MLEKKNILGENTARMKSIAVLLIISLLMLPLSGCSVVMALKQPTKKNLNVLSAGASRDNIITYLGAPIASEIKDGKRVEIYQFTQGYSGGVKASRALWHGLADLLTIFIWELIGMSAEAVADGNQMTIKITFDDKDRIEDFVYLQQPS